MTKVFDATFIADEDTAIDFAVLQTPAVPIEFDPPAMDEPVLMIYCEYSKGPRTTRLDSPHEVILATRKTFDKLLKKYDAADHAALSITIELGNLIDARVFEEEFRPSLEKRKAGITTVGQAIYVNAEKG
ncbi:MAG TPA: hypothetical protein P5539_11210 [Mesotoga sp.]|nr:hypothetical protein [Mesotoga sp.]